MRIFILSIIFVCIVVLKPIAQNKIYADINKNILQLNNAYVKNDYNTFWELFPGDFNQFVQFYGYSRHELGLISLYNSYNEHLSYLFSNKLTIDKKRIRKLISISIDGYWEADATGLFQDKIRNLLMYYPELFIEILLEYSDNSIRNFWEYILYEPYPYAEGFENDKGYRKFFRDIECKICARNERIGRIVYEAYNNILQSYN